MDWPTAFSSVFAGVGGGVFGSLLTIWVQHRFNIARDKLAEERIKMQKTREASSAVADILGEWIKSKYMDSENNINRWHIQTTYWRNIMSLDKDLVKLLVKRFANLPESPEINEIIVEARRILLDLKEQDIKPSDLNTWPPEV
ncbi:MAG TPA: hypothetical protein PLK59_08945 [Synergistales bacterium]|nr:hypothetical protein [Synergistales bacterium]